MGRRASTLFLTLGLLTTACTGKRPDDHAQPATRVGRDPQIIRVGYQKTGSLYVLRGRGTLEERLAKLGAEVKWIDFPSGPALYEAMRGGSVDLGYVGETPPIFAVAGGVPFVYAAYEPPSPGAEAILVPNDSPVRSVAELRGKRVAFNRGSNVHFLLVRALAEVGLGIEDIEPVFLPPADGRTAFEAGHVDAWIVWDPFYAAAEMTGAKALRDAEGLVNNRTYYVARRSFAVEHPKLLEAVLAELEVVADWAKRHPAQVAALYSESTGLPVAVMLRAEQRHDYGAAPMNEAILAEQQGIAEVFFELGLVPKPVDMRAAFPDPVITWESKE